jgi:hypothetical protein
MCLGLIDRQLNQSKVRPEAGYTGRQDSEASRQDIGCLHSKHWHAGHTELQAIRKAGHIHTVQAFVTQEEVDTLSGR